MSDQPISRRDLLALLGLGALGVQLPLPPRSAPGQVAVASSRSKFAPATGAMAFPLGDVRLLDGPFRDAQQRNARYLLSLDADRMLHNFRVNAGLPPKAPVYLGWESEEPWVSIRCHGHTLGHYLSAVALMFEATSDLRFADRATYIVRELEACQKARGDGLVCAFPDGATPLEDAIAGRQFAGVPWYTMHKIFAGLRDAHMHMSTPGALPVVVALAEWTWRATRDMDDRTMQRMLDTEHGGMTEVLADVSALAREPRYLELARRFAHHRVLDPLAEGRDTLDGLHANTQVPKFVGYQRVHELSGDAAYGAAARFFWQTVTARRSYATGGHGDGEHFFPVGEFEKRLGSAKTMETCCTHNMLRLTRALFTEAPSSAYADYYERALYNGILASQDPATGMNTYFQATRPGYVRLYHTRENSFWCCTGTGIENHAKYGDSIYFHTGDALYVNLFIASTVAWRERGLSVRQSTRFPDEPTTDLTMTAARPVAATIRVRYPAWCDGMTVAVNGRAWAASPGPDGYVAIRRTWRTGDTIHVHLPMALRTEPLPGAPNVVAFAYGPIVLAGRLGEAGLTPGAQIIKNERESGNMLNEPIDVPVLVGDPGDVTRHIRPIAGPALSFETTGLGRPRDVQLAPFFRLTHERYVLYWRVQAS